MRRFVLYAGLLLARPAVAQLPVPAKTNTPVLASAVQELLAFADEVGACVRQVLAEPNDAVVLQQLRSGTQVAQLRARKEQLQPKLDRWRTGLTDAQIPALQAELEKAWEQSQVTRDLNWLDTDTATVARFRRNPALKSTVEATIYGLLAR